jgi:very-short-patch-repair endonuclease
MVWKQASQTETTLNAKVNARRLRRALTDAEKTLWKHLRGDLAGTRTHFRRQVPIGPYVADFCCLGARLIVELDGPVHRLAGARQRDAGRDEYLRSQGFSILRFNNDDIVLRNAAVLQAINAALGRTTPTPGPSPQGGGETRVSAP